MVFVKQNREPSIEPPINIVKPIFDKEAKATQWKEVFLTIVLAKLDIHMLKNKFLSKPQLHK